MLKVTGCGATSVCWVGERTGIRWIRPVNHLSQVKAGKAKMVNYQWQICVCECGFSMLTAQISVDLEQIWHTASLLLGLQENNGTTITVNTVILGVCCKLWPSP